MDRVLSHRTDGRILWVDVVRVYATVSVIVFHVAGPYIYNVQSLDISRWWASNVYATFFRVAIPLFVMVSGALLLDPSKEESTALFFGKRARKVFLPFVAWAAIYMGWLTFYHGQSYSAVDLIKFFIGGPIYFHLWFVYMIIGLYLITPILRVYVSAATRSNLLYFSLLWFIAASVSPFLLNFFGVLPGVRLEQMTGYVGYYILGIYLKDTVLEKKGVFMWIIFIVAGFFITSYGTYHYTVKSGGTLVSYLYDYFSPSVIPMAIGTFLVIRNIDFPALRLRTKTPFTLMEHINRASFGIYLLHPIVLELMDHGFFDVKINGSLYHNALGIPLTAVICALLSFIMVTALQRIPIIRHIVP